MVQPFYPEFALSSDERYAATLPGLPFGVPQLDPVTALHISSDCLARLPA